MSLNKLDANQVLRAIFSEDSGGIRVGSSFIDTSAMLDAQDAGSSVNSDDVDISAHLGYSIMVDWSGAAAAGPITFAEQLVVGTNTLMGASDYYGQTFTADGSGNINEIDLGIWNDQGATGNFTLKIYNVSAGQPDTLIGTSDVVDVSTLSVTSAIETIPFSTPVAISDGSQYYIIFDTQSLTGNIRINYDGPPNPYAGGAFVFSEDSGATYADDIASVVFSVKQVGAGALDGVVKIQASLDGVIYKDLAGLSVDIDSASGSQLFNVSDAQYKIIRANYEANGVASGTLNVKYFLKG